MVPSDPASWCFHLCVVPSPHVGAGPPESLPQQIEHGGSGEMSLLTLGYKKPVASDLDSVPPLLPSLFSHFLSLLSLSSSIPWEPSGSLWRGSQRGNEASCQQPLEWAWKWNLQPQLHLEMTIWWHLLRDLEPEALGYIVPRFLIRRNHERITSCCSRVIFFFFLAAPNVLWDLSSLTRDWAPGATREVLFWGNLLFSKGFPSGTSGKEPICQCRRHRRHGFDPWVRKIPWRRKWQLTPVFWPEESHGQRSLVVFSL